VNDRHGKPAIRLGPKIKAVLKRKKAKSLSLSITHTDSAAAAVCLLC